jgi:hypothetical protein
LTAGTALCRDHAPPASQPETVVENTVNHFEHKARALNRG